MNKLVSILISVIILLTFSFCCVTKSNIKGATAENHPFKVTKATSNTWVGGQPGVKGIKITITIDNSEIKLDSIFFRNRKAELKRDTNSLLPFFVGIMILPNTEKDYILDKNPVKEYGNKPPNTLLNIPFELKNNEAIVSYIYEENTYYYKIEKIKSNIKY